MARLLVIRQAGPIEQDSLPIRPVLPQAGIDPLAIEGVDLVRRINSN
jgi:hypothetical protein